MVVAFNEIPQALRVPLFYAEFNSGGTVSTSASRLLYVGQKLAAGSAKVNEPVLVASGKENGLFGSNSMLASMVRYGRESAPFQEIWALPVDDAAIAAAKASGKFDFTTVTIPTSGATVLTIYVDTQRFRLTVTSADTAATLATRFAALINADASVPVTAVAGTAAAVGTITVTARWGGATGNYIDLRTNLLGDESSQSYQVVVTKMAGGVAYPDVGTALSNLGEDEFDWIVVGWEDADTLIELTNFLNGTSGRWSPIQQLYGHATLPAVGTVATLSALGDTINDSHTTIVGLYGYKSAPWNVVAAVGAKEAKHLSDAPELSRPLQFISLPGIYGPDLADRFSRTDRNILLYDGISTLTTATDGTVQIERLITTYRFNAAGFSDSTYLDVNTLAQNMYSIRYIRSAVTNSHGRQALANDDNPPIQGVSRPRDVRDTIVAAYVRLRDLAVVEDVETFEQLLVVERSVTDSNRIDVYLPTDAVNQLNIIAVNATTFLQFPAE